MTDTKAKKPNDYIDVTVNGQNQTVFMSGGLVRQLAPYVASLEEFSLVFQDVFIQNDLIVEALRPRNKRGVPADNSKEPYTINDFELTQEDANKLVIWIAEHVLHFFADSVTSAQTLVETSEEKIKELQKLTQSLIGSRDSVGTTPSAGPSIQSQAK